MPTRVIISLFRFSLFVALIGVTTESTQASIIGTSGLTNVRIWETTGVTTPINFAPNGAAITTQLGVGVLGLANNDFTGAPTEHYDVFYSDANGIFNLNGDFITVEAVYPSTSPGPGLNLAAVDLQVGSSTVRADILASFVGLGPNFVPASVPFAVDTDLPIPASTTRMGNTSLPPSQHLRVTVGFSSIPEPSSVMLMLCAVFGAVATVRRQRN